MPAASPWTEDLTQQLRDLVAEGKGSRPIGMALGMTKGQIVGKCMRLGLSLKHPVAAAPIKVSKPIAAPLAPAPVLILPLNHRHESSFVASPSASHPDVMALRSTHCRWPLHCDDGQTRYCGKFAMLTPYCADHREKAFKGTRGTFDGSYKHPERTR